MFCFYKHTNKWIVAKWMSSVIQILFDCWSHFLKSYSLKIVFRLETENSKNMNQDFCNCYYPWPNVKTVSSGTLEVQFFLCHLSDNDRKFIFLIIFHLQFNILAAVSALYQNAITHSIQNKTSWMLWPPKTHTPTYNLTPTRSTLDQHFYLYLFYQLYYGYLIRLYTLSKICLFNVILCDLKN